MLPPPNTTLSSSSVVVPAADLATNFACREITRMNVGVRSIGGERVLERVEIAGSHILRSYRLDVAGCDHAVNRPACRAISLPAAAAEENDDAAGHMDFAKVDMGHRHRRTKAR